MFESLRKEYEPQHNSIELSQFNGYNIDIWNSNHSTRDINVETDEEDEKGEGYCGCVEFEYQLRSR
jgi:hypothetical protein